MADGEGQSNIPLSAHAIMLRRLKVALLGAVIIPALLLLAGAWNERTERLHSAGSDAVSTVTALREHAFKAIGSHELLIRELDRRLEGMNQDEIRASSAALSAEIAMMRASMPEVLALAVTDADGRLLAGGGEPEGNGKPLPPHDNWPAGHEDDRATVVGHSYAGSLPGRRDFDISRRRTTPDGIFDGTIRATIAASYFADFWSEVTAGQSDVFVGLVRLDGEVLARFPETGEALPLTTGAISALVHRVQADPRGGVLRTTFTSNGIERIYAYSQVGNYPLVVGYGIAVPSVIAPWRQHLMYFGGVGVLLTVALVLAVLATMRQLNRLDAEQARRIGIEQAMQKGQRLELLGQLTAGIAHDFANILQAMGVVATLLKRSAGQPDRVHSLAGRLAQDVERGASLAQRMLDLVRQNSGLSKIRQVDTYDLINPAEAMARVCDLLPRLLGSGYRLHCELPVDLPALKLEDRSELELVVMNLAVNARDAMPAGGEIVIRVASERIGGGLDETRGGRCPAGLAPGPYVRISVVDNGVGMSPEVLAQVGVPFFTTKPQGRGTGLGLAGATSFAARAGGKLCIESQEGCGTTVTLWLPAAAPCQTSEPRPVERVG